MMTISQLRKVLKIVGDVLSRAAPLLIAIADALVRRPKKPQPPQ